MGEKEASHKVVCTACGSTIPAGDKICPQCGNVYHEDTGEWEWMLDPQKGGNDDHNRHARLTVR